VLGFVLEDLPTEQVGAALASEGIAVRGAPLRSTGAAAVRGGDLGPAVAGDVQRQVGHRRTARRAAQAAEPLAAQTENAVIAAA
jgi:hypothetical protein